MDKPKINLDKPYGDPSNLIPEVPAGKEEIMPKEEPKEVKIEEEAKEVISEEKPRVTYSRFKNVHERAIEAEREARELRARVEQLESIPHERYESPADGSLPDWWTKLYGDTDASKEAYQIQSRREEQLKEELRQEAIQALYEERRNEEGQFQSNLQTLDDNLENLTAFVGRDLTENEQSAVLDIVDEYTPKNDEGDYLGAVLPFDKAWEIYELKNEAATASSKSSRNQVANLTSSGSQGEPGTDAKKEEDKNFNPFDWDAYKKFL